MIADHVDMTLEELFASLTDGVVSRAVEVATDVALLTLAKKMGKPADLAREASEMVRKRLLQQARRGVVPPVDRPEAYLKTSLRRAAIDISRKRERAARHAAAVRAAVPEAEALPPPTEDRLLVRIFEEALSYRAVRYRASVQETWREQQLLHGSPMRLREILAERLGCDPEDSAVDKQVAAAHKRHQRLFKELRLALKTMRDSGVLRAFEYGQGCQLIERLRRRARSSPGDDVAPDDGGAS